MNKTKNLKVRKYLQHGHILGIKVTGTSITRVLRKVQTHISEADKFYIVTPNSEIVMQAQTDMKLKKILNEAKITISDGIGLAQAKKFMNLPRPNGKFWRLLILSMQGLGVGLMTIIDRTNLTSDFSIINGRKMFLDLIKLSNKKKWRVFLLGGRKGEASGTKKELEKVFKSIKIRAFEGPELNEDGMPASKKDEESEKETVKKIDSFKPHLLFVAFGAPKQEKWVYRNYKKLDIGGAMVVGGTFKYVSGKRQLPPKWVEDRGLEWIWRLLNGNQTPKRIFTAFPTFPLRVFWEKWKS